MAFAIAPFNPIVAFGITFEHPVLVEPAEGSDIVLFDNTAGTPLAVGDPLFIRSADETVLQYLGLVTGANDFGLSSQIKIQDAVGASATIWTPTNEVRFTGEVRGSQAHSDDDGGETIQSSAGKFFTYQSRDPSNIVTLSFSVRNSTAAADWETFRTVDRHGLIDPFNLSYYDIKDRKGKTIKVIGFAGDHPLTPVNWLTTRLSQTFGIEAETPTTGVYVES